MISESMIVDVKVFMRVSTDLWRKQMRVRAVPISFVAPEKHINYTTQTVVAVVAVR